MKARAAIYNQDRKYSPEAENKRCSGRGGETQLLAPAAEVCSGGKRK